MEDPMVNLFLGTPDISEHILDYLDNINLVKCRKVCKFWKSIVDKEKVPFRFIRLFTNKSDMELRQIIVKTNSEANVLKSFAKKVCLSFYGQITSGLGEINDSANEYCTVYNNSPLESAVEKGHLNICNMLLHNVLDLETRQIVQQYSDENATSFANKVYLSCLFVRRGQNYNGSSGTNNYGESPLHIAAKEGFLSVCHLFIDCLETTTVFDGRLGDTPLHLAARNGNLAITRLFIQRLTDKNPGSTNGYTPLHMASMNGHLAIVQLFVNNLVDINPEYMIGISPFHYAAMNGHLGICKLYLKKLEDKNPASQIGNSYTPYHYAAMNGHTTTCQLFVDTLRDKNPSCPDGTTPFHLAAERGHFEICKLIIENVQDKNPKNSFGLTPLYRAANDGRMDLCELIVEHAENLDSKLVNVSYLSGRTPLHAAARNGHLEIYNYLLGKLKEKSPKDDEGKTPLDLAMENGYILDFNS